MVFTSRLENKKVSHINSYVQQKYYITAEPTKSIGFINNGYTLFLYIYIGKIYKQNKIIGFAVTKSDDAIISDILLSCDKYTLYPRHCVHMIQTLPQIEMVLHKSPYQEDRNKNQQI